MELAKGLKPEPDETLRRQRLTEIVEDAKALVAFLDRDHLHPSVAYLKAFWPAFSTKTPNLWKRGYRESNQTHPDQIISAVDPEARHGAKSKTRFTLRKR